MTSLLKGFVGTLSEALDFNQATLSGCIDIVVVEHDDGTRHSTPFHVRFGKLQLLRSREKVVTIMVNGEKAPFSMKLGRAGEAFFVEEVGDESIDDEWATSPIHSPYNSPSLSPSRFRTLPHENAFRQAVVDCLNDLIDSVEDHFKDVEVDANVDTFFNVTERALAMDRIDALAASDEAIIDDSDESIDQEITMSSIEEPPPLTISESAIPTAAPHSANGERVWTWWSWRWGSLPVRRISQVQDFGDDMIVAEVPRGFGSGNHEDGTQKPSLTRSLSWVSSFFGLFRRIEAASLPKHDPDLVDVRVFVTANGHLRLKIDLHPESTEVDPSTNIYQGQFPPPASLEHVKPGSTDSAASFELSLCGHLFEKDAQLSATVFQDHLVTFERLCADPSVVYDPNLVVRYNDILYPGPVALPLIMSLLAFGKPLDSGSLERLGLSMAARAVLKPEPEQKQQDQPPQPPQAQQSRPSFLYRWFGGSSTSSATAAAAIPTPAPAPPLVATVEPSATSAIPVLIPESGLLSPPESLDEETSPMYRKTLRPTSDMLCSLDLNPGANVISFSVVSSLQGIQIVEAYIYLWKESDRIVVSDVDGTITRSDLLGNIMPLMGKDWSQYGVTSLFSNIAGNGYHLLYLTSRAIGQANVTRAYLHSVRQGAISLPQGPVIMSPDSLISSFKREVIYRRPQEFKIPALRDIAHLFPKGTCPFVAGFGNRDTDIESYTAVGVPPAMIFIIDPKGAIHRCNSIHRTSYVLLNEQVEHMFPPITTCKHRVHPSFSHFQFWRDPIRRLEETNGPGSSVTVEISNSEEDDESSMSTVVSISESDRLVPSTNISTR
ncbi:phosphatidate phosphatase [Plasmodiophora brassicae]